MPSDTGSRPIHHGKGAPVFGIGVWPPAAGPAPGALPDPDPAPATPGWEEAGAGETAEGDTAPGVAEGRLDAELEPRADGDEANRDEADGDGGGVAAWFDPGLLPEWTFSTRTARKKSTAVTAASGSKDWGPDAPRRAMACLVSVGFLAGV